MTTAPERAAESAPLTQEETLATLGRYDFGWSDPDVAGSSARRGLSADVVADMLESGETPPDALSERQYSGKFVVRVPPEVHRKLAIDAAEQNTGGRGAFRASAIRRLMHD